jgi:drug/metabolite transporter (DMT)-like permease
MRRSKKPPSRGVLGKWLASGPLADIDEVKTSRVLAGLCGTYSTWSLAGVVLSIAAFGPAALPWQAGISAVGFLIYLHRTQQNLQWVEAKRVFFQAVTRVVGLMCFLFAFLHLKVGVVDTIIACGIFLSVFVFARLEGERPRKNVIYPLLTSIVGVALLCDVTSADAIKNINPYLFFAFAAMVAISTSNYLWRKTSIGVVPHVYLTYMHMWVFVLSIPALLLLSSTGLLTTTLVPSAQQLMFLAMAVTIGSVGDIMFTKVQKYSTYITNAVFSPAGAVFTPIFGFVLKGESLTSIQIVGVVIVALSIGYASYLQGRPQEGFAPRLIIRRRAKATRVLLHTRLAQR